MLEFRYNNQKNTIQCICYKKHNLWVDLYRVMNEKWEEELHKPNKEKFIECANKTSFFLYFQQNVC